MRSVLLVLLLVLTPFLHATVTVAGAANVSFVVKALIEDFHKKHPDIKVNTVLSSSGKLTAQIEKGAPYDLFLSADMRYPQKLYKDGFALTKPKIYAKGALVLITFKGAKLDKNITKTLTHQSIKKIAVANPKTAPYGRAAKELLENMHLYEKLKSKFIYGESISNTFVYAQKAADVGFVAKSLLLSPNFSHLKEGVDYIEPSHELYTPISQGIVLLKYAKNNEEAKKFYDYLFSTSAKNIFQRFGYITKE